MPIPLRLLPALVAPPLCWSCRAVAPRAEPLCRTCRARLRFLGQSVVPVAGVPLWAAVAFEGPARALVHGFKYRGGAGLADPLAAQMAANLPRQVLAGRPTLVPVPAAPPRARSRGYDQAALLAGALGRRTGLDVVRCLRRSGGASQVGRGRAARREALDGVIALRAPAPPAVLLVDDVATTGATLAACARVLEAQGSVVVAALTYARAPGR